MSGSNKIEWDWTTLYPTLLNYTLPNIPCYEENPVYYIEQDIPSLGDTVSGEI